MIKYLKIAFRNVIANKRRSLFISIAIAIGTIIMVLTSSLSNGVRDNMIKNSLALFTGHVNVYGIEYKRGERLFRIPDVSPIREVLQKEFPEAEVKYRSSTSGKMFNPDKNVPFRSVVLLGIDIEEERRFKEAVIVIDGELDSITEDYVAMIDKTTADQFQLDVGDTFSYETKVDHPEFGLVNNTARFRVGAIIQGLSLGPFANFVRVNLDTATDFQYLDENQVSRIAIFIDDKNNAGDFADRLEQALKDTKYNIDDYNRDQADAVTQATGWSIETPPDGLEIKVRTWQEELSFLEQMITAIDIVSFVFIAILMFIVLMGISNTLVMTIKERTGEIGTLRAIGMQRPSVLLMFVLEGLILGFFGALLGILIGGSISLFFTLNGIYIGPSVISLFLVNNSLYFKITLGSVLIIMVAVILIAVLASIYPSYRASRMKPVTAIQKD
jgi:ABC-type lipoprotein release transport system permease subunit